MTLIEIMVVVVIMAVMASAVAISVIKSWNTSRRHDTVTRARTIQSATAVYLMEQGGGCPTVEELAQTNVLDPTTDHADAWGNAFAIECDETAIHVRSAGPDETAGTADDIGF